MYRFRVNLENKNTEAEKTTFKNYVYLRKTKEKTSMRRCVAYKSQWLGLRCDYVRT